MEREAQERGVPLAGSASLSRRRTAPVGTEALAMTAIEHLRSVGVNEDEARRAVAAIAAVLPVDSIVRITEEVLEAARAGNLALVSLLLAQEVDPEPEDFAALESADCDNDGTRFTEAEVRARLGL